MPAFPADFQACLSFVLRFEGGYSENPSDPGGPTNMGITLATLSAWRRQEVGRDDIRNLTLEETGAIYRKKYWDPCQCERLPQPLALVVFDTAVNSGIHRSVMFLQSVLDIPADGIPGLETLAAVDACDIADTVRRMISLRMAFLEGLPTWNVFGAGWTARCGALQQYALAFEREDS